jgi:hypothetical protein
MSVGRPEEMSAFERPFVSPRDGGGGVEPMRQSAVDEQPADETRAPRRAR